MSALLDTDVCGVKCEDADDCADTKNPAMWSQRTIKAEPGCTMDTFDCVKEELCDSDEDASVDNVATGELNIRSVQTQINEAMQNAMDDSVRVKDEWDSDLELKTEIDLGVDYINVAPTDTDDTKLGETKPINTYFDESSDKPYVCTICNKRFKRVYSLNLHVVAHTGKKAFKCDVCDKCFTYSSGLNQHKLIHRGLKAHKCDVCDKKFFTRSKLMNHVLTHYGIKKFKCEYCAKGFTRRNYLDAHLLTHTVENPRSVVNVHKCKYCEKVYSQKKNLNAHMKKHTGEKPHQCVLCENPFKCSVCDENFSSKVTLRKHLLSHGVADVHKCTYCEKEFSCKSNLNRHMITHTGNQPYNCELCDKMFARKRTLTLHMLIHTGENPHKCDMRFFQGGNLKRHTRTNSKPFNCTMCKRRFKLKRKLTLHMFNHTASDMKFAYKCTVCGKRFASNINLTNHMFRHTSKETHE